MFGTIRTRARRDYYGGNCKRSPSSTSNICKVTGRYWLEKIHGRHDIKRVSDNPTDISNYMWFQTEYSTLGEGLVTKLLECTHGQWLYRNVHVHDSVSGAIALQQKEEIQHEIEKQQDLGEEGLTAEDHYLMEVNLEDLETTSGEKQEYWLLAIRAAREAFRLRRIADSTVATGIT